MGSGMPSSLAHCNHAGPLTRSPPGRTVGAMTMAGKGVLAFWHDVAPGGDGEFDQWHLREHIPERVAVPGFLRCRRYATLGDPPRYFYFYETESLETLQSPAYLARLGDPTPWTKKTLPLVRNNTRTACRVVAGHLLEGDAGVSTAAKSDEKKLLATPDALVRWVVLVEGIDPAAIESTCRDLLSAEALARRGATDDVALGFYRLQLGYAKECPRAAL